MEMATTKARRGDSSSSSCAGSIFRRSIYTFLQNYHYLSWHTAFIALPFSASILLSQSTTTSSVFYGRLEALFSAAGFPPSQFLCLKLSQTISSSILTFPFALSFLLFAKASLLITLEANGKTTLASIYIPLLHTYLWNSLLIISANATAFSVLFLAFNILQGLGFNSLILSSAGAVLYSVLVANALIISNLALVLSGVEARGGYMPILKACVLIRGRTAAALSLAIPISLGMAGIEALFQFRLHQNPGLFEPLFISYMHSLLVLLDTIVGYMFLKSCNNQDTAAGLLSYQDDEEMGNTSLQMHC